MGQPAHRAKGVGHGMNQAQQGIGKGLAGQKRCDLHLPPGHHICAVFNGNGKICLHELDGMKCRSVRYGISL